MPGAQSLSEVCVRPPIKKRDASREYSEAQNTRADLNALKFQSLVCRHGNWHPSQYLNISSLCSFTVLFFPFIQIKVDEGLEFVTNLNSHKHLCIGK